jgi:hypothetical protein
MLYRNHDKDYYLSFIGKQFIRKTQKRKDVYTVTDCMFVYNSKDECVKVYYHATYEFLGQQITDHDVCIVTIQKGLTQ